MKIEIKTLDDIDRAAAQFVKIMKGHTIFAFYGGMGAGKTSFIKAVCRLLGTDDIITSPSFAIVNEYALPQTGGSIYHFDFYRIKQLTEVYDIGYEDYFYSGDPCFIEWPELIEALLPDDTVRIHITTNPDDSRTLDIDLI